MSAFLSDDRYRMVKKEKKEEKKMWGGAEGMKGDAEGNGCGCVKDADRGDKVKAFLGLEKTLVIDSYSKYA